MKWISAVLLFIPILVFALDAPVVSIDCEQVGDSIEVALSWTAIPGATQYCIYTRGTDPYGYGIMVACVEETVSIFRTIDQQFFFVVARDTPDPPPEYVLVPAGSFTMGQTGVAEPEHQVALTHDFYLGAREVTNQQYLDAAQWAYDQGYVTATGNTLEAYGVELLDLDDDACQLAFSEGVFSLEPVHEGAYAGQSSADHPVIQVTWYGAACYCDWLSELEDLTPFYHGSWNQSIEHDPYTAEGYRLPTEAEWEYAARYNDGRTYAWGDESPSCDYANFTGCAGWTAPGGSYPAGASNLGLFDLAGNVFEWCGDWYTGYTSGSQVNPYEAGDGSTYGAGDGSYRILRGGSWPHTEAFLLAAFRVSSRPPNNYSSAGFRVSRSSN